MSKPRVFVTRRIPRCGVDALEARCDVSVYGGDGPVGASELREGVRGAAAVVSLLTDRIDGPVFDAAGPALRIVANLAVGFDNIDIPDATGRGIWVTNTPGVLTEATADLTWALILAVTRRLLPADRFLRQGRFQGWDPLLFTGMGLGGKTLGIVGFGRIGRAVAKRAGGFGMRVLYHDPSAAPPPSDFPTPCRRVELDEVLVASDVVSVHCPLTSETAGLFDRRAFARMKATAFFINAARGRLHDENALAEAVKTGRIGGAGLDVFEDEPAVNPTLCDLENVVLLPHIGSATEETRSEMARMAALNCLAALDGRRPPNALNEIGGAR